MRNQGVVALDIGGSLAKAGVITVAEPTTVQGRCESRTGSGDGEKSFAAIAHVIHEAEKFAANEGIEITGYGVTTPGPVTAKWEATKPQLGWEMFPLLDRLKAEIGSSNIAIANDANAAAFGCWWHLGKFDQSLLLITVSTGVGAGFILPGGHMLDGATGNGAEFGHVPFGDYECEFKHGIGCVEGSISGSGIKRHRGIDPREATAEIRHEIAVLLGTALVGAVALYDPANIVVMGSVAYGFQKSDEEAGIPREQCFIASVRDRIREVSVNHRELTVSLSEFGDDTGILGAAALALPKNE